jgi:cation transport ATPase-like protein
MDEPQQLDLAVAAGLPVADVLGELGSSDQGLSRVEVEQRLAVHGPNVLLSRGVSALSVLVRQLRSYPLLLLLFAAVVSAVVGVRTEALIIVGIMAMSVGLSFFNDYRSEKAVGRCTPRSGTWRLSIATGGGSSSGRREFDPAPGRGSNRGGIQPPTDASWSCQVCAHPVEQNGSPFLTAISGRPLRQFTQHPSPRRGGSAGSDRRSANLNRASSASFP